jgi:hypothetical protein
MRRAPGTRLLAARAVAITAFVLAATTCGNAGDDGGTVVPSHSNADGVLTTIEPWKPLPNAPLPLLIPTYDSSGQAVEPTVLHFAKGWHGHPYWMVVSPYPYADASHENPSIEVSEDGLVWGVPDGLTNPIVEPRHGTFSDATLVYDDASDELWVYYLEDVINKGTDFQSMWRTTSVDGINWSAPLRVIHGWSYPIQSPSVVKAGGTFTMWTVNSGPAGCKTQHTTVEERTSTDGINWTKPHPSGITVPGHIVWHLNMIEAPTRGSFVSLLAAYAKGAACDGTRLFLARSDGLVWGTYPDAVLAPSPGQGWDNAEIYRSSLLYDRTDATLRVWYSARDWPSNAWHVGYTQGRIPVE